ncbi:MAG: carboxy terminal-processing peptidase [Verrucomicrobiales bacterium]|nr:carboxy terminal-processing peptidase [Verrucomicrobiales bacterium]
MRHLKIKTPAVIASSVLLGCSIIISIIASPATTAAVPGALSPGPNDGRIAYVTARLLEEFHYSQQPLDAEMSERFLDGYIETLDPRRENFLQSDIAGFAHYRTNLDRLTITTRGIADLTPAFEIYQRFLERLREHDAYVEDLLKHGKFKFTGSDRILIDRRHAPYPKDLDEAKQLWRDQLRYQYLQEKLSRELSATNDNAVIALSKTAPADIAETLAKHYRWNFHMATNWDSTDVLQAYLNAMAHAYDPHTDYLNNQHAQDFSINMSLSLFGIGAQLTEDDGYCTISKILRGGPADKSRQLNEKDRIVAVAQGGKPPVDVVDMELGKVVQLIRGSKGTEVRLTISPAADRTARHVVTLTRDEIKLEDSEAKAKLIEMPNGHGGTNRIGVIDLPSFYATIDLPGSASHSVKSTTTDVAMLIKKLEQEKVDGIILDLRSNPGGSLEEAIKFTGLFIKDGPIVLARSPDGSVKVDADTDSSVLYGGPLAVLINRFSASAAEIAAAALQDYGRAIVIGDISTHGKGTVQNLNPLGPYMPTATNDPGTVKITIRKFYRVSGASTQLKGVVPDIILPDVFNYSPDIGETALENPLPWDTIPSVKYDKLNLVEPFLADLRLHSEARVMSNQDFAYIQQDIQQFKKMQADKTASLNEREQIKERRANQARQKARDKEREARQASGMKTYEITVKNSEQPGLPEPMSLTTTTNHASGATYDYDSNFDSYFKTNGEASSDSAFARTNKITSAGSTSAVAAATDKKSPPPDPALTEAEHILEDYISLLSASRTLIAR